ncbi:MAG: polysaccharide biosynthesis protein [Treponemataceae bacterium]
MINSEKGIYIIGAGFAGQMIAQELKRKKVFGKVISFIDDDKSLIGTKIDDIPVLGPIENLAVFLQHTEADNAIIAIPSAPQERIRKIYEILSKARFSKIRIVPSASQIINGNVHLIQTREINPLDILGRTPVTISLKESLSYLRGKRVLITGAGGSIGSELARQLLSGGAERLYLFGHGENSIYQIDRELRILQKEGIGEKATIVPVIGELKDKKYMHYIMKKLKCDAVFHCAAYKHVPMMEENPVASIENNVFGTQNLLEACLENGVKRFVLISTDKAVMPVSVYGVSKMLCEKLVLKAALSSISDKNSAYMFVRFGNVLGSRGSIIPLFAEQLKTGGPLTVTDPKVKRFFMTIPEACSLVLQTGGVGKNGNSYLLDMGEPIKILELAEQIIRISGLEPYKDVDIKFIGLRKGERMEEPLWTQEEDPTPIEYNKILKLKNDYECNKNFYDELIKKIEPVCFYDEKNPDMYRNRDALIEILCESVPSLKEFYKGN